MIRIVTLEAGAPECPIHISLSLLNFDSHYQPYKAISYVWGESKDRKNIICEGKCLSVTKSLYEALHVFRNAHKSRRLWADGICINQSDKDDRSHQVQLMSLVYSRASKVLIWLG
ncbi:HET-domain-containing protein, partial [Corynespora cassiicola Philippines]